ncbi:hypothetical protein FRB97_004219 [Tulasnella sp. 331]|nr:hypothetical protein FRB97_004219 [Tulasnella sp. 331]
MRSTLFIIVAVLSAALVNAESRASPASILQNRAGASCSNDQFFYPKKSCCLPSGGLQNTQCPSDRQCPSSWYWHPDHNCCVPKTSSAPPATCSGPFNLWDDDDQCCKKPTPTPAPVTPTPDCPSGHFFYSDKACCLPQGGPGNNPICPSDRSCPSDWWWHGTYDCCVPKYPNSPSTPACDDEVFHQWDNFDKCCKQPPAPPPTPSGSTHKPRGQNNRKTLKRQVSVCPPDLQECPIKGSVEVECVDGNEDLRNCGGRSALGLGKDCIAIPNAVGVSCLAGTKSCKVTSCDKGYAPSTDGTACFSTLVIF